MELALAPADARRVSTALGRDGEGTDEPDPAASDIAEPVSANPAGAPPKAEANGTELEVSRTRAGPAEADRHGGAAPAGAAAEREPGAAGTAMD